MSPRDWKIRLQDMLDAMAKCKSYLGSMSVESFMADEKTVDAVIRNFTVIGEAAAKIPEVVRKKNKNIPWDTIIGMRNFVVHENIKRHFKCSPLK